MQGTITFLIYFERQLKRGVDSTRHHSEFVYKSLQIHRISFLHLQFYEKELFFFTLTKQKKIAFFIYFHGRNLQMENNHRMAANSYNFTSYRERTDRKLSLTIDLGSKAERSRKLRTYVGLKI